MIKSNQIFLLKKIYDFTELWFYQTILFWVAGNRGVTSLPPKWSKLGVPAAHLSNSCVKNSRKTQYGLQTFNLWRHWWPERYGDTTPLLDFSSGIDDNAELWFCRIRFFAPPSADLMIMLDDDIAEWKLYVTRETVLSYENYRVLQIMLLICNSYHV